MPGFPSVVRSWPRSPGQLAADDKRSAHWHGSVARSDRAVYLPELVFFASLLLFLSVCLSRCWSLVVPAPVGWGPIARPAMTVQLPFTSVPSRVLWMMMIKCGLSLSSRAGVGRRCFGRFQGAGGAGGRGGLVQATHIPTSRLSREPNRAWRFEASGRLSRFVGVGFAGKLQETGRAWGWGFRPGSRVSRFWLG